MRQKRGSWRDETAFYLKTQEVGKEGTNAQCCTGKPQQIQEPKRVDTTFGLLELVMSVFAVVHSIPAYLCGCGHPLFCFRNLLLCRGPQFILKAPIFPLLMYQTWMPTLKEQLSH